MHLQEIPVISFILHINKKKGWGVSVSVQMSDYSNIIKNVSFLHAGLEVWMNVIFWK